MRRGLRLLGICILAALAGVAVAVSIRGEPPRRTSALGQPRHESNIFSDASPLGVGEEISRENLATKLNQCGVCTLPDSGDAELQDVAHAWSRSDGAIAVDFADGLRVYFHPDPRTNDEYLADTESELADGKSYSHVDVRGVLALARAMDGGSPSALALVEGGYLIELIGHGGQTLDELVAVAAALGGAHST